jgi:hypothetical protein
LVHVVGCGKVALEDVCPAKDLFMLRADPGTKWTDHGTSIVGEGMAVLVILPSKSLCMIFTGNNGAFFRTLFLMRKHMCRQVLDNSPAIRMRALASVVRWSCP